MRTLTSSNALTNQTPISSRSRSTSSLVTTAPPAGMGLNPYRSRRGCSAAAGGVRARNASRISSDTNCPAVFLSRLASCFAVARTSLSMSSVVRIERLPRDRLAPPLRASRQRHLTQAPSWRVGCGQPPEASHRRSPAARQYVWPCSLKYSASYSMPRNQLAASMGLTPDSEPGAVKASSALQRLREPYDPELPVRTPLRIVPCVRRRAR